jgi:hypothetical protein
MLGLLLGVFICFVLLAVPLIALACIVRLAVGLALLPVRLIGAALQLAVGVVGLVLKVLLGLLGLIVGLVLLPLLPLLLVGLGVWLLIKLLTPGPALQRS